MISLYKVKRLNLISSKLLVTPYDSRCGYQTILDDDSESINSSEQLLAGPEGSLILPGVSV